MAQSCWSKPRYPLQAVMEDAPAILPSDGKLEKFMPDVLKRNGAVFSPSHLPADDYSDDQSSTAGLMSRSMTRTGDEDNASSTTLHSRNDLDPSRLHETPWSETGGTFHMLSTTSSKTVMRSSSLSTTGSDYALEQSLPGSFNPTHKTLKRTSRHRRIESPIPLSLDQEPNNIPILPDWSQQTYPRESLAKASKFLQKQSSPREGLFFPSGKRADEGDYIGPHFGSKGAKHQAQSADYASATTPGPILRPEQDSTLKAADDCLSEKPQRLVPTQAWRRGAYPLQMGADDGCLRSPPTPPPSPPRSSPAGRSPRTTTCISHQNDQSVPADGELTRDVQPSEHATSTVYSGTSEFTRSASPSQHAAIEKRPSFANRALRRQAYPLQSPASHADLQGGFDAAGSELGISREDSAMVYKPQKPDEKTSSTMNSKPASTNSSKQSVLKTVMRRQAYPLQSPASVPNFQQPIDQSHTAMADQTAKRSSQADQVNKPIQTEQDKQVERPKAKAMRRQGYPLQTPVSFSDLQDATLPTISSNEEIHLAKFAVEESAQLSATFGNDGTCTAPVSFQRHGYPLQASAGTDNTLSASPVSLPKADQTNGVSYFDSRPEMYDEPDHMSQARSPKSPTSPKSPGLRRRQTYPMQFIEDEFQEPPSPPPSTDDDEEEDYYPGDVDKTKRILLPRHVPAIRSPEKAPTKGRTIVVCLDGTGDKFDNDNSNIVHLVSALKKDDPHQVTYYQAGIGTYSANGLSKGFAAASDMAVGSGLGLHVRDAYHFLMHVYKENDRICIFGFSRGAYTARCLAGMIHKVGLLPPRNDQQIVFAYEFYKDNSTEGWEQSADFKKAFCIDVNVHFLGCFDSVASVGFIPRQLPLSTTPTNKPKHFRHAMALDERRAKFKICRYIKQNWDDIHPAHKHKSDEQAYRETHHPNLTDEEYDKLSGPDKPFDTDVLEVWFAGAHADVGGGAVLNSERHKLAQIPLRWMIRQAFECNTGILFKSRILAEFGLDVHTLWPRYSRLKAPTHGPPPSFLERYNKALPDRLKRKSKLIPTNEHENGEQLYHLKSPFDDEWTPEQVEDFYDAMMPINDQLIQAPTWWILETIPVEYKVPLGAGKYITRTGPNCGQYRGVEDAEPNLHWTVKRRMEQMGYKIQARTAKDTKWRIVV